LTKNLLKVKEGGAVK